MIRRWEAFPYDRRMSWGWKHCREPHAVKVVLNIQWIKWYLPKSTAFICALLLFNVSNILNPSQTLQGALLPTVTSARTWDYEVQSENLCNPQLEELHWRNNKEIIKRSLQQKSNTSYKSGTSPPVCMDLLYKSLAIKFSVLSTNCWQ